MIVTWGGHAQLFVNAANRTLLMDPWFAEPVFGGAWFRYPPPPFGDSSLLPRPDFLLLSHTHPDHSGLGTLAQMQKNVRVLAVDFASGGMRRRLAKAGLHNVQWLTPFETHEVAEGLKVTFVLHDGGWEVSSMVVEAEGTRLYHGNDNPLSVDGYREIVRRLGPVDLAFLPYAGASSYPTGFDGDAKTLEQRCQAKKVEGLSRFTDGLEGLRPGEAVPFASSWALLEEGEIEKNFVDRMTAEEVLRAAVAKANDVGTKLLHMEPGDEWAPDAGVIRQELTRGWANDVASIRRYASEQRERIRTAIAQARAVTTGPSGQPVSDDVIDRAFHRYFGAMLSASREATKTLSLRAGFAATGPNGEFTGSWHVVFTPGHEPTVQSGLTGQEDEVLMLPRAELATILLGSANWEDVWYGYRLHVKKRPGAGYFRAFWEMLLGFDDEATSARLAAELLA